MDVIQTTYLPWAEQMERVFEGRGAAVTDRAG